MFVRFRFSWSKFFRPVSWFSVSDVHYTSKDRLQSKQRDNFLKQSFEVNRYDGEVQPTPGVGEVLLHSIGRHLHNHLTDEDKREDFVHEVQNQFQCRFPLQSDILDCLQNVNSGGRYHDQMAW